MDNSSQSQLVNVVVEHDYAAADEDELNLCRGDTIRCVERRPGGWWWGELRGRAGLFPDNFVKVIGSVHDVLNGVVLRNPNPNPQYCRAMFSYQPANHDELSLSVGDIIQVLGEVEEGWWKGQRDNQQGVFPSNFVVPLEPVVQPPPVLPPKAVREQCKVLFPYTAANGDELSLAEGDIVTILTRDVPDQGWWRGELRGRAGLFPDNFVTVLPTMSHGANSTAEPVDKKPVRPVKILTNKNQPVSMNRKDSTSSKSSIGSQENVAAVRKSLELTDHTGQKSRRSGASQPGDNNSTERLRKSVENDAISKQKPRRSLEVEGSGKPPVPAKKASSPVGSVFSSIRQKMLGGDQRSSERNSSLDVSDGASSSKPSGEPSLLSVSPSATSMGRPPSAMDSDVIPPADGFDQVERFSMLADPRIGRAKPPGRRPPSQAPRDDIPLTNGSSHPPAPSEILVETEVVKPKAREWEKHKAPWMDELKLNQAKKTSPIAEIGRSKTISTTDNASSEKIDASHSRLSGSNDKILESSATESDKDSPPPNPIEMSQSMTSISSKTIKIETSEEVQARTENPLDMSKSMSSLASRATHLETNNKVSSSELRTSISSSASVVLRSTTVPQHGNAVAPPASINNSSNNPGSPLPGKHQNHPVPVVRPTSNSGIMPQFTPLSRHSATALVDHGLVAIKHEPNEHNFVKPPTADSCARTIKFTDEVSGGINTPEQLLIGQLNERVANLEKVVEAQEERFSSALADLGSRLEKEIELRAALQAELHKLERCVTRV